ncbi:MAG: hypothetical protein M3Z66_14270 [Chloroflexota bacterium]|nr:hypothetical protein [Chloroflexota bacterium]
MTENSEFDEPAVPTGGDAIPDRDEAQPEALPHGATIAEPTAQRADRDEALPEGASAADGASAAAGADAVPERGQVLPEIDQDRGRYVEGSYGKAGREGGHRRGAGEGQYIEGEYGNAGTESAGKTGQGEDAQTGRFVEADYGSAGNVAPRSGEHRAGQYAKGDYGSGGRVEPEDEQPDGEEA